MQIFRYLHSAGDYLLIQRVVSRQLPKLSLAVQVNAAVPDMTDQRDAVGDEKRGKGGAHHRQLTDLRR